MCTYHLSVGLLGVSVLDLGNDFFCGLGGFLLDLLNVDDGLLWMDWLVGKRRLKKKEKKYTSVIMFNSGFGTQIWSIVNDKIERATWHKSPQSKEGTHKQQQQRCRGDGSRVVNPWCVFSNKFNKQLFIQIISKDYSRLLYLIIFKIPKWLLFNCWLDFDDYFSQCC